MGDVIDAETLAEWKTIAEAATPGPWEVDHDVQTGRAFVRDPLGTERATIRDGNELDATHMATFDPPTVLALIAEVERLTVENEQLQRIDWEQRQDWLVASTKVIAGKRDEAWAEVDRLQSEVTKWRAKVDADHLAFLTADDLNTVEGRMRLQGVTEYLAARDREREAQEEAERDALQKSLDEECMNRSDTERERDALQAQVDAVKATYLPHRALLPAGFKDKCVCLGCSMARALGETGDRVNPMPETTPVKDDVGTDGQTRPENDADVAKRGAGGVISWCRGLGIELDEADQAWIRRWWGVK